MYNPTFESIYSIVPSVPALLLILIPAILMTVSIVREKELGSIINFYVTPTGRLEYLIGKQLPYVAIGMINFFILVALAVVVFGVPIKGSFLVLTLCTLLYVIVTTGVGMVTSTFTSTQVAAVFVTAILTIQPTIQFAGLLQPVSTLEGGARVIGTIWPTTYYMHSSVGAYTKGLGLDLMMRDLVVSRVLHPGPAGHQHVRAEEAGHVAMGSLRTSSGSGLKELRSLLSDVVLVALRRLRFTWTIYSQATGTSNEVNNASIAFADEDNSTLSKELLNAFYPPRFQQPERSRTDEVEDAMDGGRFMFVVTIPPRFEQDLRAGRHPDIQVSIDATAMQQAGIGAGYIKNIINERIATFLSRTDIDEAPKPVNLVVRKMFNPNGVSAWFTSIVAHHQSADAADDRADRRRGHPRARARHARAPAGDAADRVRDRDGESLGERPGDPHRDGAVAVPRRPDGARRAVRGSMPLWFAGVVLYLFFATALGMFLGTISRSMAQFALLIVLVVVVLQLLSGGSTPVESQPRWLQTAHVLPADAALRQLLAGDHLPRRRIRSGMAELRDGGRDRAGVLRLQRGAVPQVDRGDEVARAWTIPQTSHSQARIPFSDEREVLDLVGSSIMNLWDVVNNLTRLQPTTSRRYRVTIFGSARIPKDHWSTRLWPTWPKNSLDSGVTSSLGEDPG